MNKKPVRKTRDQKKMVSNILMEKREWYDINETGMPSPLETVIIRIENKDYIYAETDDEIYYAEDIKIARFIIDYNNPGKGYWAILPPFPKFDYSPLSNKDKLINGTVVTHWAHPEKGEIEGWEHRFDPFNKYKGLSIDCDPEIEEIVYRALMNGAAAIARSVDPKKFEGTDKSGRKCEERVFYEILTDLQYLIDTNSKFVGGELVKKDPYNGFDGCMNPPENGDSEEENDGGEENAVVTTR